MLPFYKALEDHYCYYDSPSSTGIDASTCKMYHGQGGPVEINPSYQPAMTPFSLEYLFALEDLGFPYNSDYNSMNHVGSTFYQWTRYRTAGQRTNVKSPLTRVSSQSAYLEGFLGSGRYSSNLLVLQSSPVLKIIFNTSDDSGLAKAVGVKFLCGGDVFTASVNMEVIVSGGALGTPQILQRSGVGPRDLLEKVGVKVVVDNPHVGQHFTDHYTVHAIFATTIDFPFSSPANQEDTWKNNPEYFTVNGPNPIGLHWNSGVEGSFPNTADLQLDQWEGFAFGSPSVHVDGVVNATSFFYVHHFPQSEGSVNITGPSITSPMQWNVGLQWDTLKKYDLEVLREGFRTLMKIARNTSWGQKYLREMLSLGGAPETTELTDEYLASNGGLAWHPAGTCRVGLCADTDMRVIGTLNVRVCDTSAFPTQVDANPILTIWAFAEKLAANLRQEYSGKRAAHP